MPPRLDAIGIVSADPAKTVEFYRLLGVAFPDPTDDHLEATLPNGLRLMIDAESAVGNYIPGWKKNVGNTVGLAFLCDSAAEVDATHAKIVAAGFKSKMEPWDAFWGQRYAQVFDPDGHSVDLFAPL